MKRQIAELSGRIGEDWAAKYLEGEGWEILARRLKTKLGEIDLVARRGALISFVEVKWRKSEAELASAVDEYRLARVAAAAESVAHLYAQNGEDVRIDVILLAPGAEPRHMENVWQP